MQYQTWTTGCQRDAEWCYSGQPSVPPTLVTPEPHTGVVMLVLVAVMLVVWYRVWRVLP